MFADGGQLVLDNVIFSENVASMNGGGFHTYGGCTANLNHVSFTGNTASGTIYGGGGMINWDSTISSTGTIFMSNEALHGGGLYNENSTATMTNATFISNTAANNGGGLYNVHSSVTLTNAVIQLNQAANHGGGIHNDQGSTA